MYQSEDSREESVGHITYMRVQEPLPGFMVKDGRREEQNNKRKADQQNGIVEIHLLPISVSRKVEPDENAKKSKKQAWELGKLLPVEVVPGVELENKGIIDLVLRPHATGEGEQNK